MFYITGDTHGKFQRVKRFARENQLTADDTIVVLGDAGINYFDNERDVHTKKYVSKIPCKLLCIHGNHEMRPEKMPQYHQIEWNGGAVCVEDAYPNILFALDGEVYDLDGVSTIAIGGAFTTDKEHRLENGWSWFADEQPDDAIKHKAETALDGLGWKIDVVLSHTCPIGFIPQEALLPQVDQSKVDQSTEKWLDSIEERLDYRYWYCGHYHIAKDCGRLRFMFDDFDRFWSNGVSAGQGEIGTEDE